MASLITSLLRLRGNTTTLALALLACTFLGMAKKSVVIVRFYAEANKRDSSSFSKPITLNHPVREAYVETIPTISEKMIKAVYPHEAKDGSWGCTFALDNSGRLNLEVVSTERRGSTLVGFIISGRGVHQAVELLIDKPVTDGVIDIPSGLSELEIDAIKKAWPVLGPRKRK